MNAEYYMNAKDLMEELGISRNKAYDILHEVNEELKEKGYMTIPGRAPREYLKKRFYGFEG